MDLKPTVGGRRAHIALDQTRDAGRPDHRGQEYQHPSGWWQSGEYNHTHFGAAVWVPHPALGRPSGLPTEPCGVGWETY